MNKQELQTTLTKKAMSKFNEQFRNVLALQRLPIADLWKRMGAVIELSQDMSGELEMRSNTIDQPNWRAANVGRDGFVKALFEMSCRAFHTLQLRGVITFVTKLTPEAKRELEDLEIAAGIAPPRPVPLPAKTAAQVLEDTVIDDFARLPGDKFRLKMNDAAYRHMYEHLSQTGKLTSRATTIYRGNEVGS
jgi:hypothetical protein